MLPVTLVVATAALAAPPVDAVHVEVPFAMTAAAPASNVETALTPWLGVRAGKTIGLGDASFGFDGALYASWASSGTSQVSSSKTLFTLEARALFSPGRLASTYSSLSAYGFAGVLAGGGVVSTKAFPEDDARPIATWGARAGLGGTIAIHGVTTSVEIGAGVRDLRFELSSSLALGYAF